METTLLNTDSSTVTSTSNSTDSVVGTISLPSNMSIPTDITKTGNFITVLVRFFIIIAGLFALVQFLLAGFSLVTAGGDKAKITEATGKITNSIIGIVIVAASFVIIAIISKLLYGNFNAILFPTFQSV